MFRIATNERTFCVLLNAELSPSPFAGITNYPIGVGINAAGEVTIADNHNNFNLSVFSQVRKKTVQIRSVINYVRRCSTYTGRSPVGVVVYHRIYIGTETLPIIVPKYRRVRISCAMTKA